MIGKAKLVPIIDSVYAGMQVVDKHNQIKIIIDPILKWRGPGPLSYDGTRLYSFLGKFKFSETTVFMEKQDCRELVIEYNRIIFDRNFAESIQPSYIPIKYDQWGAVNVNKELFEKDLHFHVETVTVGTTEFNFSEIDVANVLNIEKIYTEYDMQMAIQKVIEKCKTEK